MADFASSEGFEYLNLNPILIEGSHPALPLKHQQLDGPFSDQSSLPISQLIPLIIHQRGNGSFLNITEASLEKELADPSTEPHVITTTEAIPDQSSSALTSPTTATSQPEQDEQTSYDQFMSKRETIINYIKSSLNESSLSLDFISLLISSVRPAAGSSSISPHLKSNIKIGSLSSDRLVSGDDNQQRIQADLSRAQLGVIARGWKLEGLDRSIDKLESFKKRLTRRVSVDACYYNDLLKVLETKEVLIKHGGLSSAPGGGAGGSSGAGSGSSISSSGKEIAVKFGFGDSGSSYFDKGIGLLKKDVDNDGSVVFEKIKFQQLNDLKSNEKLLTVKIYHRNSNHELELVGESNLKERVDKMLNVDSIKVVKDIMMARFFIFEEELFYQLLKEATTLISLQVTINDSNKIVIDFHDEVIELEFIPSDEIPVTSSLKLNRKANEVGVFLRLMLCCEHKENLDKKKIPPVAMSSNNARSYYSGTSNILKPLINHTKHNKIILQVKDILESIINQPLIPNNFKLEKYLNEESIKDPWVRCFKIPASRITLLHSGLKVIIEISSSLFSTINVKLSNEHEKLLDSKFNDVREVEDCLTWCLNYFGKDSSSTTNNP